MTYFNALHPDSRVWIFQADRGLSERDKATITAALNEFVPTWAAHGNALYGDFLLLNDYQIVVALDESKAGASGCSIDSMTRVIQGLGSDLGIDFFQRMNVLLELNGKLEIKHFAQVSEDDREKMYYDNTIQSLSELNINWKKPATSGWLATRFK